MPDRLGDYLGTPGPIDIGALAQNLLIEIAVVFMAPRAAFPIF